LIDNPKMKFMTIVAFGLLVFVAIAVASPNEADEYDGTLAYEVYDAPIETQVDGQSK